MATQPDVTVRARDAGRPAPIRELRDSVMLLALVVSSLGAYVALGMVAVKLLAGP